MSVIKKTVDLSDPGTRVRTPANDAVRASRVASDARIALELSEEQAIEVLRIHDVLKALPVSPGTARTISIGMRAISLHQGGYDRTASNGSVAINDDIAVFVSKFGESSVEMDLSIGEIHQAAVAAGILADRPGADGPLTNLRRANQARDLLEMYRTRTSMGSDEEPETVAQDMIASVLHAVRQESGDEAALKAVQIGLGHYLSEAYDGSEEAPDLDFFVDIRAEAPRAGVEVSVSTGSAPEIEIDEAKLDAYRNASGASPSF